jgi:hypothetical protein
LIVIIKFCNFPHIPVTVIYCCNECICFVHLVFCVPYVASFSRLSIVDCPFGILLHLLDHDSCCKLSIPHRLVPIDHLRNTHRRNKRNKSRPLQQFPLRWVQ